MPLSYVEENLWATCPVGYLFYFLSSCMGIKRCYTRILSVERLALIPVIFTFIGLRSIFQLFNLSVSGFALLLTSGFLGFLLGHCLVQNSAILADKSRRLIQVPGDISMLIMVMVMVMVMVIFCIEFFIHYSVDAHWAISDSALVKSIAIMLSGLIAGVSIGKNVNYFLKYHRAESVILDDDRDHDSHAG